MTPNTEQRNDAVSLKPCPFCNANAGWREYDGTNDPFGLVVDHAENCFLSYGWLGGEGQIRSTWNARAQLPEGNVREALEAAASIADGQVMSGNDQWAAGHDAAARKVARGIRALITDRPAP